MTSLKSSERPPLVFMGTPDFAVPALQALFDAGYPIKAVYTQPPRPKGRGHQVHKSAVHTFAEQRNLSVLTPLRLKEEVAALQALAPHFIVVAAYGLLLPAAILEIPRHGCLNIHASLLPRWRGAAPIQYALLEGDMTTGVTLMCMDEGMDTGAMLAHQTCPITAQSTSFSLTQELAHLGAELLLQTLPLYFSGQLLPVPQPTQGIQLAPKIKTADGRLCWTRSAKVLERQIRALDPWPGAWFITSDKRFKIHTATVCPRPSHMLEATPGTILDEELLIACGEQSALRPLVLTPEGSKRMPVEDCLRGYSFLTSGIVL